MDEVTRAKARNALKAFGLVLVIGWMLVMLVVVWQESAEYQRRCERLGLVYDASRSACIQVIRLEP